MKRKILPPALTELKFSATGTKVEGKDSDAVQPISMALKFHVDFLFICTSMARLNGTDVRNTVENVQSMTNASVRLLERLSEVMKRLDASKPDSVKALIQRTFNTYVNRPLVGNSPLRTIDIERKYSRQDKKNALSTITTPNPVLDA
eukprot:scaffold7908_cov69-Cylindrotheca_fusiformis.AAC.1